MRVAARLIDRNVECWELEECGAWMNWIKRSAFPCKENHKVPKMPCIVFVVEKLNWTQLHEETGLRIEACGWDRIEIDGTEGFKLCQGYPSQEGGSFLPQEETFWILKQNETLCYLLTVNKLSMSLCLSPLCIFDKVPSRKDRKTVIECNQSGQDYKRKPGVVFSFEKIIELYSIRMVPSLIELA